MTNENNVQLPVEIGTPLMVNLFQITDQLKCILAGVEKDKSLIVQLPSMVNSSWNIQEQMGATVRFVSQGSVFGFNSYVQGKLIKDSMRFLFLAFPTSLEIVNLRQSQRIECHLPARLTVESRELEGVVLDIGIGGASFLHKLPDPEAEPPNIHLGMEVSLDCALWGLPGEQSMVCQVRKIHLGADSLFLGMSFVNGDDQISQCISCYVEKVTSLLD